MLNDLRYNESILVYVVALALLSVSHAAGSPGDELTVPIVVDGKTQVVPEFKDLGQWVRHDLWVETEFDSDGDSRPDRMHVDVTRPRQTDTPGIKLPVILHCSPYFGGTGIAKPPYLWNVRHELGTPPPERQRFGPIERKDTRPIISKSYVNDWVPHGYAVVHSSSPGTGFSEGCPTIGKDNESLAIKSGPAQTATTR